MREQALSLVEPSKYVLTEVLLIMGKTTSYVASKVFMSWFLANNNWLMCGLFVSACSAIAEKAKTSIVALGLSLRNKHKLGVVKITSPNRFEEINNNFDAS